MNEECAIIGYYCINPSVCVPNAVDSLEALQHRGRESSGISAYCERDGWTLKKGIGLVKDVFKKYRNEAQYKSVIGHNRYSTSAKKIAHVEIKPDTLDSGLVFDANGSCDVPEDSNCVIKIQPFHNPIHGFSMVHNGNIQNVPYEKNDSQYIFEYIGGLLGEGLTMYKALQQTILNIKGIYNIIIQNQNGLYLMRDRFAVRPFYYGVKNEGLIVCGSETVAFGEDVRDIKEVNSGEIIYIGENRDISKCNNIKPKYIHKLYRLPLAHVNPSFCIFEYFYFMNHDSYINDRSLYDIRYKLGTRMARNDVGKNADFTQENTIIVGSPNSGIAAGQGYAFFSGLNYYQCIHKKKDVGRTFILPTDRERQEACKKGFEIVSRIINGKHLIIVDDTIVRGNTFRELITQIKESSSPLSIHVRIASPKIVDRCNLGIDLPTQEELVTHKADNIAEYVGANSIGFLDLEEIKEIVGGDICTKICGCFKGGEKYNDW
jgi:amidophosphoribosyltransferase